MPDFDGMSDAIRGTANNSLGVAGLKVYKKTLGKVLIPFKYLRSIVLVDVSNLEVVLFLNLVPVAQR
jgi:hypothetical protein